MTICVLLTTSTRVGQATVEAQTPTPQAPEQSSTSARQPTSKDRGGSKAPPPPVPFFPVAPVWSVDLGAPPSAPPAFDEHHAYVPLQSGSLAAVALDTGEQKWTQPAPTTLAPAVDEGRVFVVGESELSAVDAGSGRMLWRSPLAARGVRRPAARGGWVILALESGEVAAMRGEDGKTVWTVTLESVPTIDPFIEGDRLFVTSTRGLTSLDLLTGKKQWDRPLDGNASAATRANGAIYIGTSGRWFYAVDDGSGRVRWRWRVAGEPIGIVANEELAVVLMLDHTLRAFKVGSGAQAWREPLLYRPAAGPVRVPGQLLVGGHDAVVRAYNEQDGKRAGSYSLPASAAPDTPEQLDAFRGGAHVRVGATIVDDLLVFVTRRGTVHAARRQLVPVPVPVTQMPGTPVNAPARPPEGAPAASSPP